MDDLSYLLSTKLHCLLSRSVPTTMGLDMGLWKIAVHTKKVLMPFTFDRLLDSNKPCGNNHISL